MTAEQRGRAIRRTLLVTLALNAAVAASKVAYGTWSNALSIRADGFHSIADSSNNLIGLVAVSLASRPADAGHPYGHYKFEAAAAGVLGLSLFAMAFDVIRSAFERLGAASAALPEVGPGAFAVLLGTLAVNLWVSRYEQRRGSQLGSTFLLTDAAHTRSDVVVTASVLLTTGLVHMGFVVMDLLTAFFLSAFIAWTGIGVLRRNVGYLADAAVLDPREVGDVAARVPGVASTHKIRTRGAPGAVYVDLHIQIAPHLDVVRAHNVTHAVIGAIKRAFPSVIDVLVHTEPAHPNQAYTPFPEESHDETGR
jgi:cation diffusion facilitator family transporter